MDEHDELTESTEELPEAEQGADPEMPEETVQDTLEPEEEAETSEAGPEEEFTPVDLNTASEEELQQLPGIGETLAARIISYREGVQPFREAAEITLVPGVSQATYERIAQRLVVSPAELPPIPELEAEVEAGPEPEEAPGEEEELATYKAESG